MNVRILYFILFFFSHVVIVVKEDLSRNSYDVGRLIKTTKKFIFSYGGVLIHILTFVPRNSTSLNKKTT